MSDMSFYLLLAVVMIWSITWKGIALWNAARNEQRTWFIAVLLINIVGLLEITYLMFFQEKMEPRIYSRD